MVPGETFEHSLVANDGSHFRGAHEDKELLSSGRSQKGSTENKTDDSTAETFEREADTRISGSTDPEKATTQAHPSEFPEGGWAGWSTVFGAFLIQLCGFGYTSSFGVYQDFYTRIYITNESSSTISWIGSVNAFMTIMGGILAGKLFDKGYFYYQIIGGAIVQSFCLFMLSLAKPDRYYQIFLSQGLGVGLAAGMMYVPSVAVVSHYFRKRRALAMTLVASGSSLGSLVHPIMLNNLLHRIGFANAARANAGLVSGTLLVACLLMRTRLPANDSPIGIREALRKFSRDKAYACTTIGITTFSMGYYYPIFYMQLDAVIHGLNSNFAFYILVILNGAAFLGRLSPGLVVHRLGVANMLTFGMGSCSVMIFAMIGLGKGSEGGIIAGFVVVAALFGFFAGTYISLASPLLAAFADNQAEIGARIGFGWAFSGIGALLGSPIDGALVTSKFIWWKPALFSGLMAFAGFCFMLTMMLIIRLERRNLKF